MTPADSMPHALRIRRARPTDASDLTALATASKKLWGYDDSVMNLWRSELTFTPDFIRTHTVLVAEESPGIIGVAAVSASGTEHELEHLWVHPSAIGRGIGSTLFRAIVEHVTKEGTTTLFITSDPNAEQFYLGQGAIRQGTVASTPLGRQLPRLAFVVDKLSRRPPIGSKPKFSAG